MAAVPGQTGVAQSSGQDSEEGRRKVNKEIFKDFHVTERDFKEYRDFEMELQSKSWKHQIKIYVFSSILMTVDNNFLTEGMSPMP